MSSESIHGIRLLQAVGCVNHTGPQSDGSRRISKLLAGTITSN